MRLTRTTRRRGYTLIEVLISMGAGGIVLAALGSFFYFSIHSFVVMANYCDLDIKSRQALDVMTRDIRQCNQLLNGTDTTLDFEYADGKTLSFQYTKDAEDNGTVRRIYDGRSEILLQECDYLKFSLFQRNPIGGSYDQYPSATADLCKMVQLNWTCSRKIFGNKVNTESVQTAKIVIRKQQKAN